MGVRRWLCVLVALGFGCPPIIVVAHPWAPEDNSPGTITREDLMRLFPDGNGLPKTVINLDDLVTTSTDGRPVRIWRGTSLNVLGLEGTALRVSGEMSAPEFNPKVRQRFFTAEALIPAAQTNLLVIVADLPAPPPREVSLTTEVSFPLILNGRKVGSSGVPAGTRVRVVEILENDQIKVALQNRTAIVGRAQTSWAEEQQRFIAIRDRLAADAERVRARARAASQAARLRQRARLTHVTVLYRIEGGWLAQPSIRNAGPLLLKGIPKELAPGATWEGFTWRLGNKQLDGKVLEEWTADPEAAAAFFSSRS